MPERNSNHGPRWSWIGPLLLTGAFTLNTGVLGWLVNRQMATEDRLARIETMITEKVREAEAKHASYVTRPEMDLAIERAFIRVEDRLRDLSIQLGIRYRGPVDPPGRRDRAEGVP